DYPVSLFSFFLFARRSKITKPVGLRLNNSDTVMSCFFVNGIPLGRYRIAIELPSRLTGIRMNVVCLYKAKDGAEHRGAEERNPSGLPTGIRRSDAYSSRGHTQQAHSCSG